MSYRIIFFCLAVVACSSKGNKGECAKFPDGKCPSGTGDNIRDDNIRDGKQTQRDERDTSTDSKVVETTPTSKPTPAIQPATTAPQVSMYLYADSKQGFKPVATFVGNTMPSDFVIQMLGLEGNVGFSSTEEKAGASIVSKDGVQLKLKFNFGQPSTPYCGTASFTADDVATSENLKNIETMKQKTKDVTLETSGC